MSRRKGSVKTPPRSTRSTNKRAWREDLEEEQVVDSAVRIFKWSEQSNRVVEGMRSIFNPELQQEGPARYRYHQSILTDVTLFSSDGKCVEAHKLVLSLCSPYFKDLFVKISQNVNSSRSRDPSVVVLGNVTGSQLHHLMEFIYTGEAAIPSEDAEEFTRLGDLFQIEGLSSSSSSKLYTPSKSQIPSNSGTSKDNPAKVIKVRLINDKNQTPPNDTTTSPTPHSSDNIPCKLEPPEDLNFDDDIMDRVSNFSDELNLDNPPSAEDSSDDSDPDYLDETSGLKTPKKRGRPRKSDYKIISEPPPGLRKRKGDSGVDWRLLEPISAETLKKDWRQHKKFPFKSGICVFYYCAYGTKCPANLKVKTFHDGTVVYFHNQKEHANHRLENHGLTPEQKAFALECMERKIVMTNDILLQFQVKGLQKPNKEKLKNMLQSYKRKYPEKYATPVTPLKWPRRIRPKKVSTVSSGRKPGRPKKPDPKKLQERPDGTQPVEMEASSGSGGTQQHQMTSAGSQSHPNHFPAPVPFHYGLQQQIAAHHAASSLLHQNLSSAANYSLPHSSNQRS